MLGNFGDSVGVVVVRGSRSDEVTTALEIDE